MAKKSVGQTRFCRHLFKLPTTCIAVKGLRFVGWTGALGQRFRLPTRWFGCDSNIAPGASIDEKEIHQAIAVKVQDRDPGTHRFRQELFAFKTILVNELDARLFRHVHKFQLWESCISLLLHHLGRNCLGNSRFRLGTATAGQEEAKAQC